MTDQALGPSRDYCPAYTGAEGHHMVSHSAGEKVRWIERCSLCGWVDTEALDRWADNAIKEALSARAQRIAVATETEPFAFVQSSTEELPLREILLQALGAAHAFGVEHGLEAGDGKRLTSILRALEAEVERSLESAWKRGHSAALEEKESAT